MFKLFLTHLKGIIEQACDWSDHDVILKLNLIEQNSGYQFDQVCGVKHNKKTMTQQQIHVNCNL